MGAQQRRQVWKARPASSCDGAGNLYVSDNSNNRVWKVEGGTVPAEDGEIAPPTGPPIGNISTVAGNGEEGFSGDGGAATLASFKDPASIFVDAAGNLYIADKNNHRIRKVEGIAAPPSSDGTVAKSSDFDGDGTVDFSDFVEFSQNFEK